MAWNTSRWASLVLALAATVAHAEAAGGSSSCGWPAEGRSWVDAALDPLGETACGTLGGGYLSSAGRARGVRDGDTPPSFDTLAGGPSLGRAWQLPAAPADDLPPVSAVDEPGTAYLLLAGLCALAYLGKRRPGER